MSLLVSETANKNASSNNLTNNLKIETKLEPITWPFRQQQFDFKFNLDANKQNNNNDDDDDDDSAQQQNASKRNNSTAHQHSLENSKKTKLNSNSTNSNNCNNNSTNSNSHTSSNESNHLNTIIITESYSILKIKCKCIHILNRLICLVILTAKKEPKENFFLINRNFTFLMFSLSLAS